MLPDPLHPAIVHLPIALALVVPALAIVSTLAIRRGALKPRVWTLVVLLQVILSASAWVAVETGEEQEERVERVVAERYIETHAEAAERFAWTAAAGLVLVAAGLLPGGTGAIARLVATGATLVVLATVVPVGRSGGALVYEHGAADAYRVPADRGRTNTRSGGDS